MYTKFTEDNMIVYETQPECYELDVNVHYRIELEDGYGKLFKVRSSNKLDMYEKDERCCLWNNYEEFDGLEYDTNLFWWEEDILKDLFVNIKKI